MWHCNERLLLSMIKLIERALRDHADFCQRKKPCMDGLPNPPKNVLRLVCRCGRCDDYGAGIGLYNNCLGVFIKPVCEETELRPGGVYTAYDDSPIWCAMAVLPFYGKYPQRYG
jgi:hypothetical protein